MQETYYAGAYWRGRTESLESYAQRAAELFRLLAPLDAMFSRWFEQANSREKALQSEFTPNAETLLGLFKNKKYQRGGGDVSFAAWNGESVESAVVGLSCGSRSPHVVDRCTLTPPSNGPGAERFLSASALRQALRAMVLAWEPEFGIVTSHVHRDEVLKLHAVGTFVGWMMYFSRQRGPVPALPKPVQVEAIEGKGTMVILTPERFTASNPEHIAIAARVQELLAHEGLLEPLQPLMNQRPA
jgi:hypothetical protein